jgi:hypothetical protein
MGPPRQGGATAFAWQGETERRKEKTEYTDGARGWWAAGRKGGQELQEPAPPANERGCKSAAAAWMSLLSLCDRICGTAAWLVPITCLRGVRFHLLCTFSRPGITPASDPTVRRQVDELARDARDWRFEVRDSFVPSRSPDIFIGTNSNSPYYSISGFAIMSNFWEYLCVFVGRFARGS